MRRAIIAIAVFALTAAACGGTAASSTSTTAPAPSTTTTTTPAQPSSTTTTTPQTGSATSPSVASTSTTEGAARPPLPDDAVAAPEFSLGLGDGGTFVLADAQKPVYMVFWAEW